MTGVATSRLAIVAAALVGVQVGAATVASRFAIIETDPITLAFLRYVIGVLCLAPFVLAVARVRIPVRDLVPIAALGTIQFGVLVALLNYGLKFIPAGRAAVVFATFPLMTMLLAAALGREALTPAKTFGVLLTIAGVALALADKAFTGVSGSGWIGEAAVLASAACGATCSVLYRPYLQRYPTLQVGSIAMLASVLFLGVVSIAQGGGAFSLSGRAWAAVFFIGASSGIGYFALLWALARASPTRVTVFQTLAPLTAAFLGWLLLGEALTPLFLAGLALVAIGILAAHR